MKKIIGFLCLTLIIACNTQTDNLVGHELKREGDKLQIRYSGEGDVVQFKMFEGLSRILKKNALGVFEGLLEIQNLDNGIFTYDIIVHKKDSLGKMVEVEYPKEPDNKRLLWIGENRNISFLKATKLLGTLTDLELNSDFLKESRTLTIYNPKEVNMDIPIIYLTDGSNVKAYAEYVDKMISEGKIKPIKLVGVHSSYENRYSEYVDNGLENDFFKLHEDFFYKEVLNDVESKILNWKGKRYAYGVSNGAAFCMHAGINHPEMFEEIIAFSTADYISEFTKPIEFNYDDYPKFYMGAGRYEESIFRDNNKFVPKLKAEKIDVEFKEFISGHDYNVWKYEFLTYLEMRFGV